MDKAPTLTALTLASFTDLLDNFVNFLVDSSLEDGLRLQRENERESPVLNFYANYKFCKKGKCLQKHVFTHLNETKVMT